IPSGTAAQKARRIAMTASSMVTRKRSFNWSQTGVLYHRDVPRSPRSTLPSQLAYWTYIGRSRPSRCRNCWSCSGETVPLSPSPPPRIDKAGSPGKIQNRANTMTVANSRVGKKSSARRTAYWPIRPSRLWLVVREWDVGVPPEMFELLDDLLGAGDMEVLEP